jgi:putative ATP-grasp target RiPP
MILMRGVVSRCEAIPDNPLSSAILRYSLGTTATAAGPGQRQTRPFGLRFARTFPLPPPRPAVRYCHSLQVAVDDEGRPMVERLGWEEDQKKEWVTKAESDGDEGKEEDTWAWEET